MYLTILSYSTYLSFRIDQKHTAFVFVTARTRKVNAKFTFIDLFIYESKGFIKDGQKHWKQNRYLFLKTDHNTRIKGDILGETVSI